MASSSATSILITLPPPVVLPLPAKFLPFPSPVFPATPRNHSVASFEKHFQAQPPYPQPLPSKDFSASLSTCEPSARAIQSRVPPSLSGISPDSSGRPGGRSPATREEIPHRHP